MNPDDTPTGRTDPMITTEWLDAVRADLAAATPGPWRTEWDDADKWHSITGAGHGLGGGLRVVCPEVATVEAGGDADANLIASAPDRLDRMERALRDVMALHGPLCECGNPGHTNPEAGCPECDVICDDCGSIYPCPTVTTIQVRRALEVRHGVRD